MPSDIAALSCLFLGGFVVSFGLCSRLIKENLYLSEPILCTLIGLLLSKALGIFILVPDDWDRYLPYSESRYNLAWLCRVVIGVQVLFAASTLPSGWLGRRQNLTSMMVLLLPVMTAGWLISSVLVKACFPTILWTEALIIGACIAPTDPVLANSVVKGTFAERYVPVPVRQLLLAESGLNDGFGTPFLFITIFTILNGFHPRQAIQAFVLQTVLYDVIFGSLLGVAIGYLARKGLKVAHTKEQVDREGMLVFSGALALFTVGLGQMLGTNGLLACFFAGIAVNWTNTIGELYSPFSEGTEFMFDSAVFFVLGTILPVDTWIDPKFLPLPNLIVLAVLILLFRRLPAVMAMYKIIPVLQSTNEAFFAGYFGPIGVSALYYALIATERLPDDYAERNKIIAATTFIIFSSIVVHGLSTPLYMLTRRVAPNSTVDNYSEDDGVHSPIRGEGSETTPLLGHGANRRSGIDRP